MQSLRHCPPTLDSSKRDAWRSKKLSLLPHISGWKHLHYFSLGFCWFLCVLFPLQEQLCCCVCWVWVRYSPVPRQAAWCWPQRAVSVMPVSFPLQDSCLCCVLPSLWDHPGVLWSWHVHSGPSMRQYLAWGTPWNPHFHPPSTSILLKKNKNESLRTHLFQSSKQLWPSTSWSPCVRCASLTHMFEQNGKWQCWGSERAQRQRTHAIIFCRNSSCQPCMVLISLETLKVRNWVKKTTLPLRADWWHFWM